jgi:hypothetical protein
MEAGEWVPVAMVTFEHSMIPWVGRKYAAWLRGWTRPHPTDPKGQVLVPEAIYKLFQQRAVGQQITRAQLESLGYPRVPGQDELAQVRRALHQALAHCEWDRARELDRRLRELQEQVTDRQTALTAPTPRQTAPRR